MHSSRSSRSRSRKDDGSAAATTTTITTTSTTTKPAKVQKQTPKAKAKGRPKKAAAGSSSSNPPPIDPSDPENSPLYFWKPTHPQVGYLSQWYWLPFRDDEGRVFKTAEHYMMHGKAALFGDGEMAAQILEADDPKTVKALGRQVRGFDDKNWNSQREAIVTKGNWYKFTMPVLEEGEEQEGEQAEKSKDKEQQQQEQQQQTRTWELGNAEDAEKLTAASFREVLLQTGDRVLVEASPMDRIWGVGFGAANAGKNRGRWGLNLLGKCLMEVREQFRREDEEAAKKTENASK